jgi:hypothetical protein
MQQPDDPIYLAPPAPTRYSQLNVHRERLSASTKRSGPKFVLSLGRLQRSGFVDVLCGARRQLFGANIVRCICLHMSAFGTELTSSDVRYWVCP